MKQIACLLLLASAISAGAEEQIPLVELERVYCGIGTGREFGSQASWFDLEEPVSRWRLVWDPNRHTFSRFDIGFKPAREDQNTLWWLGFSFELAYSGRPEGLYPKFMPGDGGRAFFLTEYVTENWWIEGRYPLASNSEGIYWPWSVDLREFRFGRAHCFGGELRGLLKAGYSSTTGGYAGAGIMFERGKLRFTLDSLDSLSAEISTEITGW